MMAVFAEVEQLSDDQLAADQLTGYSLGDLGYLKDQPGTIVISNEELAQLPGVGTHCLIIPVSLSEPTNESVTDAG